MDVTNRQRLDGKVAIVTGATGGIGEATAKLFLELGAKVMLVARSPDKLAATTARLKGLGEYDGAIADSTDEAATAAAVAKTVERFGGLDILIANAGIRSAKAASAAACPDSSAPYSFWPTCSSPFGVGVGKGRARCAEK